MNNQAGIRLAVIDTDSAFLTVLGKRLEGAGWEHRVLAGSVPVDDLVAMKLNALLVDLSILGPHGWEFLEKVCGAIPGLGVLVCTTQSTVAQRVSGSISLIPSSASRLSSVIRRSSSGLAMRRAGTSSTWTSGSDAGEDRRTATRAEPAARPAIASQPDR